MNKEWTTRGSKLQFWAALWSLLMVMVLVDAGAESGALKAQTLSPDDFLPYNLGDRMTPHHRVLAYVNHVAETSDRVSIHPYGTTYEGRELVYLVVTDPENHARIEEIRLNNRLLTGLEEGELEGAVEDVKPIVWLSYNIHGNEVSSSEAAMLTLFRLADPDPANEAAAWLKDVVVIIDPMLNPDGRDRYVNWFGQMEGYQVNPQHIAREHHEPWPGGRPNHYYFDLNRDWAWQTQAESMLRADAYQAWMPHVHADFHEMGYDNPYFFAPAAEPFHEVITPWQRELQGLMGRGHADRFDREGWLYFTKEWFDLLYPSYGDTWPTFQGAVGMTYEQAGHGFAGAAVDLPDGSVLTLKDRLLHHTVAGLSTVEVAAANAGRIVEEFAAYFEKARTNPQGRFKTYVIRRSNDEDALFGVMRFMDEHEIRYSVAGKSVRERGVMIGASYPAAEGGRVAEGGRASGGGLAAKEGRASKEGRNKLTVESILVQEGDLLVSAYQPQSALVQVFFEPETALVDSLTYDITAWSAFYRFGLEGAALESRVDDKAEGEASLMPEDLRSFRFDTREGDVAFITDWDSMDDARFLAAVLDAGVKVRFTTHPLTIAGRESHMNLRGGLSSVDTEGSGSRSAGSRSAGSHYTSGHNTSSHGIGKTFGRGSIIITLENNRHLGDSLSNVLRRYAKEFDREVYGIPTGFMHSGPDLGSSQIALIEKPEIAVLIGEGTSSSQAGEIWHFLDQQLRYPATLVHASMAGSMDLHDFTTVILPDGSYSNIRNGSFAEDLRSWVREGGRVISFGSTNDLLSEMEGVSIQRKESAVASAEGDGNGGGNGTPNLTPYGEREREQASGLVSGAVFRVHLDNTHPLAYGYDDTYFSLRTGDRTYAWLENGWNVGTVQKEALVSGFAGSDAVKMHEESLSFGVQSLGQGQLILFADNPLYRGFWNDGKLLVANALFFVGND